MYNQQAQNSVVTWQMFGKCLANAVAAVRLCKKEFFKTEHLKSRNSSEKAFQLSFHLCLRAKELEENQAASSCKFALKHLETQLFGSAHIQCRKET